MTVRWHPLLQLPGGSWVGLHGDDDEQIWVGSYEEAKRELDFSQPVGLLPLLEQPLSVVEAELRDLDDKGFKPFANRVRTCLEAVADVAISMHSRYWTERAIDWIGERGLETSSIRLLESIISSTWASQPIRHKALRLMKSLESAD